MVCIQTVQKYKINNGWFSTFLKCKWHEIQIGIEFFSKVIHKVKTLG